MNLKRLALVMPVIAGVAIPAVAQILLPQPGAAVGQTLGTLRQTLDSSQELSDYGNGKALDLLRDRTARIDRLIRRNRDSIELDGRGAPARKGELLLVDPPPEALAKAVAAGFRIIASDRLDGLSISVATLGVPDGMPLAKAQRRLAQLLPGVTITADTLHFESGAIGNARAGAAADRLLPPVAAPVGMIDGAPASTVTVRGFASGAPRTSDHGSAVASLLRLAGVQRIHAADVYGDDRAGGNALAVAKALDWMVGDKIRVVTISLAGPPNALVQKAIVNAQRNGVVIVAAVGNDGPAAPPSYPASYPGVIAVTGVDGRNRALIEAGRALHLDYAAPGADLVAANAGGRWVQVRGTSFAAPLVAARAAAALGGDVVRQLDKEAIDLGAKGPDTVFGRGLICTICRRAR